MAAGTDDKRFPQSCRGVSNDNAKQKEENETHVENVDVCQREHTRWHVDEAVAAQLNAKERECMRIDTRNAVEWSAHVEFTKICRSLETSDANQTAIAQIKPGLIHIDLLLLDDAVFIRCLDDKVLGHESESKFVSSQWWSSSTFVALVKVLHHRDQLPFGPHSDAVGEESVENLESDKSGEMEVLQCIADGGGALADHADVRRCGEELEEARARVAVVEAQRQRIVRQLRKKSQTAGHRKERRLTRTVVVTGKRSSSIGSQRS
jgi:uncharacterized protein YqcC (DUF446 family)